MRVKRSLVPIQKRSVSGCLSFCEKAENSKTSYDRDFCKILQLIKQEIETLKISFRFTTKKEQYEFLYQCLVDFVDMFGIYSQSCDSFNSRTSLNESLACLKFPQQQKEQFELTKLNQIKLNFN